MGERSEGIVRKLDVEERKSEGEEGGKRDGGMEGWRDGQL